MISKVLNICWAAILIAGMVLGCTSVQAGAVTTGTIPLIHCTDLFAPADDPDDYYDLACLYAIPEFDIRAVILDQGEKQAKRPGSVAVELLNRITGRHVPWTVGLSEKLASAHDKGTSQPAEFQAGVDRILSLLQETTTPVAISVVGSARDLAAAWNREPQLLKEKIRAVYVYCGDFSKPDYIEWNVRMDPHAYAALMMSDLPIIWIPCFDGGVWSQGLHNSYWKTEQRNLLGGIRRELVPFFLLGVNKAAKKAPLEKALRLAQEPNARDIMTSGPRNMWGGSLFAKMAGYRFVEEKTPGVRGDEFKLVAPVGEGANHATFLDDDLVRLRQVELGFTADGRLTTSGVTRKFQVFEKVNPEKYGAAMTATTARLLKRL